jgi:essential nuclear protein 1
MLRNDEGTFVSRHVQDKGEEDSVSVDEDQGFEYEEDISDTDDLIEVQGNYVAGGSGLTDAEEAIVSQFLKSDGTQMKTLADIIIEKIREKGVTPSSSSVVKSIATEAPIPPKVIEVFSAVGKMLQHYKSGKLPKALKMLPHLKNWEVQSDV